MGEERNNKETSTPPIISPPTNNSGEEIYNNFEMMKEYIEKTRPYLIAFRVGLVLKQAYDKAPLWKKRTLHEAYRQLTHTFLIEKKALEKIEEEMHKVIDINVNVSPNIDRIAELIYEKLAEKENERLAEIRIRRKKEEKELKEIEERKEKYIKYKNELQELIKEIVSMELFINDESYSLEKRINYIKTKIGKIKEKYSKFI